MSGFDGAWKFIRLCDSTIVTALFTVCYSEAEREEKVTFGLVPSSFCFGFLSFCVLVCSSPYFGLSFFFGLPFTFNTSLFPPPGSLPSLGAFLSLHSSFT